MKIRLNPNAKAHLAGTLGLPSAAGSMAIGRRIADKWGRDVPKSNNEAHALAMEYLGKSVKVRADPDADIFLSVLK